MQRKLQLGAKLFEFSSFQHWVNKAKSWFANSGISTRETVCIDAVGRICTCGREFMRARDEGTYPITVYHIDPIFTPVEIDYEALPEKTDDEIELERLLNAA